MFKKRDPQTSLLATSHFLSDDKRERLEKDWPGQFRRAALPLINEEKFRDLYHKWNGRPNKPVQTIVGVLLLKEMSDFTDAEALFNLDFNLAWHVALDLEPDEAHTCQKTLHNFRAKLMGSDKAKLLFEDVTGKIIEALGISTERQRLDSTHITSNIARLTRLGLFCETARAFLKELKRKSKKNFESVPGGLRRRYLKDDGKDTRYHDTKSSEAKRRISVCARDVCRLADRFRGDEDIESLRSYRVLKRLVDEQCEVVKEAPAPAEGDADADDPPAPVVVKPAKEVKSDSLQTPHDESVTYSGRKGKGQEVQIAETCGNGEKPEMITYAEETRSCDSDQKVPVPAVENLAERDIQPKELLADTNYGSTENAIECEKRGTELVSPVPGSKARAADGDAEAGARGESANDNTKDNGRCEEEGEEEGNEKGNEEGNEGSKEKKITKADFDMDPKGERKTRCPAGHDCAKETREAETGKVRAVFPACACEGCPMTDRCPAKLKGDGTRVLKTTVHAVVLARRRRYEKTEEFKKRYAERAGIEATNSELKRAHGLGRLRVRGGLRVKLAVHLKALACNVKRMVKYLAAQARKAGDAAAAAGEGVEAAADAASCVISHLIRSRKAAAAPLATPWRPARAAWPYLSRPAAA